MKISDRDVLLVVDVQNDFCSDGALAVPEGEKIVPAINRIARPMIGANRRRRLWADRLPGPVGAFALGQVEGCNAFAGTGRIRLARPGHSHSHPFRQIGDGGRR